MTKVQVELELDENYSKIRRSIKSPTILGTYKGSNSFYLHPPNLQACSTLQSVVIQLAATYIY